MDGEPELLHLSCAQLGPQLFREPGRHVDVAIPSLCRIDQIVGQQQLRHRSARRPRRWVTALFPDLDHPQGEAVGRDLCTSEGGEVEPSTNLTEIPVTPHGKRRRGELASGDSDLELWELSECLRGALREDGLERHDLVNSDCRGSLEEERQTRHETHRPRIVHDPCSQHEHLRLLVVGRASAGRSDNGAKAGGVLPACGVLVRFHVARRTSNTSQYC